MNKSADAPPALRILHVIDTLSLGGAERMLVEIANQSARDGHKISVCVTRQNGPLSSELLPEIELQVLTRRTRFDLRALRQFGRFARQHNAQILHAHGRSSFSFVAFARALRLVRAPILLHDHFGSIEFDTNVPRWFRFWGKRHVARYVGVYDKLGDWAGRAGVHIRKISVISNALDLSRFAEGDAAPRDLRAEFTLPQKSVVALMVGGLRREKGLDVLLDALAHLSDSDKAHLRVLVAGGVADASYVHNCRIQCSALKLDDIVHFLGSRNDVPALMRASDFAVLPSRSESGPLVLIEFLASGLPTVSTQVGGIAQQVKELDAALMVPPEDAAALSQGIARVLAMPADERRAMGENGRAMALSHFDISGAAGKWYALYEAMLK